MQSHETRRTAFWVGSSYSRLQESSSSRVLTNRPRDLDSSKTESQKSCSQWLCPCHCFACAGKPCWPYETGAPHTPYPRLSCSKSFESHDSRSYRLSGACFPSNPHRTYQRCCRQVETFAKVVCRSEVLDTWTRTAWWLPVPSTATPHRSDGTESEEAIWLWVRVSHTYPASPTFARESCWYTPTLWVQPSVPRHPHHCHLSWRVVETDLPIHSELRCNTNDLISESLNDSFQTTNQIVQSDFVHQSEELVKNVRKHGFDHFLCRVAVEEKAKWRRSHHLNGQLGISKWFQHFLNTTLKMMLTVEIKITVSHENPTRTLSHERIVGILKLGKNVLNNQTLQCVHVQLVLHQVLTQGSECYECSVFLKRHLFGSAVSSCDILLKHVRQSGHEQLQRFLSKSAQIDEKIHRCCFGLM